jgi:hypothetical protein
LLNSKRLRIALASGLAVLVGAALAGMAIASSSHGNRHGHSSAAQHQYGPSGHQYGKALGKTKLTLCHRGHTITVGQPAAARHLKHGDTSGQCPEDSSSTAAADDNGHGHGKGKDKQHDED